MNGQRFRLACIWSASITASVMLPAASPAWAHCDSMDGPVVAAARQVLETGDLTSALWWVGPAQEAELRQAFDRTRQVRTMSQAARELADLYFFETLVRLHRQTEAAPYTGLKPAGQPAPPGVAQADEALDNGQIDPVMRELRRTVAEGVHRRFDRVLVARRQADSSVQAGRQFVAAYVDYVHHVEALFAAAAGLAGAHGPGHVEAAGHAGQAAPGAHDHASRPADRHEPAEHHEPATSTGPAGHEHAAGGKETPVTPTDMLTDEHRVIELVLDGVRRQVQRIDRTGLIDAAWLRQYVEFSRGFVDRCHRAKEERYLFDWMRRHGTPADQTSIAVLVLEHEEDRQRVAQVADAIDPADAGDAWAVRQIREHLSALADLLRGHMAKEDGMVFPAARRKLPAAEVRAMVAAFERLEKQHLEPGAHERYHRLAHDLAGHE